MRLLLDESVPRPFAPLLPGHDVSIVPQEEWAGLKNGGLLRRVEGRFDIFVTGDRSLQYQQNLDSISFGIIVIAALNNRVETILGAADSNLSAVETVHPGEVVTVTA